MYITLEGTDAAGRPRFKSVVSIMHWVWTVDKSFVANGENFAALGGHHVPAVRRCGLINNSRYGPNYRELCVFRVQRSADSSDRGQCDLDQTGCVFSLPCADVCHHPRLCPHHWGVCVSVHQSEHSVNLVEPSSWSDRGRSVQEFLVQRVTVHSRRQAVQLRRLQVAARVYHQHIHSYHRCLVWSDGRRAAGCRGVRADEAVNFALWGVSRTVDVGEDPRRRLLARVPNARDRR
mmetsp:Transcript_3912/g.9849  ORF Transcript_3912/g.9849 Transcript_3912/m.9849 type:complete len:234 (-) Transcript_3912:265-966(-)